MTLFGGRLPIITVSELLKLAAAIGRIQLEVALCKELDKQVVRVTQIGPDSVTPIRHGLLVDEASPDYFISGRTAEAVRQKLMRSLGKYLSFFELMYCKTEQLSLFGGMAGNLHSLSADDREPPSGTGEWVSSKTGVVIT